jgi:hypothetical protein
MKPGTLDAVAGVQCRQSNFRQMALLARARIAHPGFIGRLGVIAALLGAVLALGVGAGSALAKPPKVAREPVSSATNEAEQAEQASQEAEEANEVAQEAAEVAEETGGAVPQAAVSVDGVSKHERRASARKVEHLTREIRHLRHVKERIRAKIRELRELPTSSPRRQRGQLGREREKLLHKRRRLFRLQEERHALKHP